MSEKMVLGMGRMRMETVNSHKCLFCDFWIPYGPTSTPHIHIKTDNDCCLLTQIFFCSVSQKPHCLAHLQLFLTQTYPRGYVHQPFLMKSSSFTGPRTERRPLTAQWLKACTLI